MKKKLIIDTIVYFFLLFIFFFYIYTSNLAVNFGEHWDEIPLRLESVKQFYITNIALPNRYDQPSMVYLISLISSFFYHFGEYKIIGVGDSLHLVTIASDKITLINFNIQINEDLVLFLRKVFIFISSLTIFFVFWSLKNLRLNQYACLLGAATIPLSFQFWSMGRFIAPDILAVFFVSGVIFFSIKFLKKYKKAYLFGATFFSVLACSTKYTAGIILMLPVILSFLYQKSFKNIFFIFFIFSTLFIILNPGIIVQPIKFFQEIFFVKQAYFKTGYGFLSVEPGVEHFIKNIKYIIFRISSQNILISFLIFFISVIGFIKLEFYNKFKMILFIIILIYIAIISLSRVNNIRNLTILFPFISIFFASGINFITTRYQNFFIYKNFFLFIIISFFIFNSSKIYFSAVSLKFDQNDNYLKKELIQYLNDNSRVVINSSLLKYIPDNIVKNKLTKINKSSEIFEEEKIIYLLSSYGFYYLEVDKKYHGKLVGNINQYNTIAGPKDIDLDYFPTWIGKKRVVETSGNSMKYLIDFSEKKFDYYLWEKNN